MVVVRERTVLKYREVGVHPVIDVSSSIVYTRPLKIFDCMMWVVILV